VTVYAYDTGRNSVQHPTQLPAGGHLISAAGLRRLPRGSPINSDTPSEIAFGVHLCMRSGWSHSGQAELLEENGRKV
jgi:hypothetical protein